MNLSSLFDKKATVLCLRGSKREGNENACAATLAIACRDGSAVRARDGIDEGKAKPAAIRLSSLHPALEQMRQYLRIEALPDNRTPDAG